jgi:hypothetical protein
MGNTTRKINFQDLPQEARTELEKVLRSNEVILVCYDASHEASQGGFWNKESKHYFQILTQRRLINIHVEKKQHQLSIIELKDVRFGGIEHSHQVVVYGTDDSRITFFFDKRQMKDEFSRVLNAAIDFVNSNWRFPSGVGEESLVLMEALLRLRRLNILSEQELQSKIPALIRRIE